MQFEQQSSAHKPELIQKNESVLKSCLSEEGFKNHDLPQRDQDFTFYKKVHNVSEQNPQWDVLRVSQFETDNEISQRVDSKFNAQFVSNDGEATLKKNNIEFQYFKMVYYAELKNMPCFMTEKLLDIDPYDLYKKANKENEGENLPFNKYQQWIVDEIYRLL